MTVDLLAGASSNKVSDWQAIDWPKVRRDVRRLQLRIAKAIRQTIAGMPRTGASLERLEPCEGKLSRTVLRGVWAG